MDLSTFGGRLIYARKHVRKVSMVSLAKAVDLPRPTIYNWEGKNFASVNADSLLDVCNHLNISITWLITGEGDMDNEGTKVESPKSKTVHAVDVPLIPWTEILQFTKYRYTPKATTEKIEVWGTQPEATFVSVLPHKIGDGEIFSEGSQLIISPYIPVVHGCYVVYKHEQELTIMSLVEMPRRKPHLMSLSSNETFDYDESKKLGIVFGLRML